MMSNENNRGLSDVITQWFKSRDYVVLQKDARRLGREAFLMGIILIVLGTNLPHTPAIYIALAIVGSITWIWMLYLYRD